jgi:hypothetical protein
VKDNDKKSWTISILGNSLWRRDMMGARGYGERATRGDKVMFKSSKPCLNCAVRQKESAWEEIISL